MAVVQAPHVAAKESSAATAGAARTRPPWPREVSSLLAETVPQSVVLLDSHLRAVRSNAHYDEQFGAPGARQHITATFGPTGLEEFLADAANGNGPSSQVFEFKASGNGRNTFHVTAMPAGAAGRGRLLVVIEDRTQERDQQARMIAASRLVSVGEMAAGVAHELNNPLTAILGFSQLAVRQDVDDALRHDLEAIATEAERAGRIVDNLLSFARSHNTGKRVFDAAASIRKILDLREYECRVNNIEVVTYFDPDTPKIDADVHKIEQVILNLLGNAVQAIADGPGRGTITVGLVAMDGKLRMSFTDDGPGISPDNLKRIFEPFFTTKPVGKGTGLGLSICRTILREHGGDIRVESRLRRGTTFVAELPAVPVQDTGPEQLVKPVQRPVSYTMLRVLCVDDEPAVVEMLGRALGGLGHQVDQSRDGADALRMVHLADYDAVLLDLRMPGLGGPEVFRCIQGLRPDLTDRVLFMTGDTVSPDTRAFIESTGADVLQKPFSIDELRRRMEQFAFEKDQRTADRERARRPDLAAGLTKVGRPHTK